MTRHEVIEKLAAHRDELREMGVASLALFGSVARGEAGDGSDVDLLVEFNRSIGLFDFFRVQHRLEEILNVQRVDLVMRDAIIPALRERILGEAIDAT